jgi:hypothetical protein
VLNKVFRKNSDTLRGGSDLRAAILTRIIKLTVFCAFAVPFWLVLSGEQNIFSGAFATAMIVIWHLWHSAYLVRIEKRLITIESAIRDQNKNN